MSDAVFDYDPTKWDSVILPDEKTERLRAANTKLVGALDMIRETLSGGNVDDLLYIINTALEENELALATSGARG